MTPDIFVSKNTTKALTVKISDTIGITSETSDTSHEQNSETDVTASLAALFSLIYHSNI